MLLSLLIIVLIAEIAGSGNDVITWIAIAVFVLSGGLVFFGPTEDVVARVMFRLRKPTMQEHSLLDPAWTYVANSAGMRPGDYRLWIEESQETNAFATSGHIVAITRATLELPPNHLGAVLAHELGHHVGGHAWASLLTYWYSVPGRIAARIWYWITFGFWILLAGAAVSAAGGATRFRPSGWLVGCLGGLILRVFPVLWILGLGFAAYLVHPALLLLFAVPFVLAWFSRIGEKYADRVAADLGYGQALIEVLYHWIEAGHDVSYKRQGRLRALFSTHPSCSSRIHALERRIFHRRLEGPA